MFHPKTKRFFPALAVLFSIGLHIPSSAATLDPPEIEAKIRAAKIFSSERALNAKAKPESHEIDVNVSSSSAETDNDKKINAVLIAKAAMSLDPTNIVRVRVWFFDTDESYREIFVTVGDVKSYANGTLTPKTLLDSLELSAVHPPENRNGHPLISAILNGRDGRTKAPTPTNSSNSTANYNANSNPNPNSFSHPNSNLNPESSFLNRELLKRNYSKTIHYGKMLMIAEGCESIAETGQDTRALRVEFDGLIKNIDLHDPRVKQDMGSMLGELINNYGYSPNNPPGAKKGAIDSQHWRDRIEHICEFIRSQLGEDTPRLSGALMAERVKAACIIHILGARGGDMTAARQRLLHFDQVAQSPELDHQAVLNQIHEFEQELGLVVADASPR